jgi:hypothetical protein
MYQEFISDGYVDRNERCVRNAYLSVGGSSREVSCNGVAISWVLFHGNNHCLCSRNTPSSNVLFSILTLHFVFFPLSADKGLTERLYFTDALEVEMAVTFIGYALHYCSSACTCSCMHFFNTNTVTSKLKSGERPHNTRRFNIP